MAFEAEISELIPAGDGDVLWLGSQHAQQLIDGLEVGASPPRAIVLQGLLGRFQKPGEVLQQLQAFLAPDGVVVALAAPRLNASAGGGFTRRELLSVFAGAGYDVTSCTAIHHPQLPWPRLTMEGPAARPADEVEEAASVALLVSARRATVDGPECSIVTTGDYAGPRSETVEVITVGGEPRARAWNQGARIARGRYLVFLDAEEGLRPETLRGLLKVAESSPRAGAVGAQAVAFGPDSVPCQELPFRTQPGSAGKVAAVEGAGMLVARHNFVATGGFDPQMGARFDGPDLCLRLRARGFEVLYSRERAAEARQPEPGASSDARHFIFKWRGQIPPADEQPSAKKPPAGRSPGKKGWAAPAPVLWSAPLLQRSGYGEEARNFVLALDRHGIAVQGNPTDWRAEAQLPRAAMRRLGALLVTEAPQRFVSVVNSFPAARMMISGSSGVYPVIQHFKPHPRAVRNIGRTMYETDRILPEWVGPCNQMDEIWVPSTFNIESFARAGVEREKLFRIPGAIDMDAFDRDLVPMYVPGAEGFVFLSVFHWSLRKGWDVLLRAFLEEFDHGEDVTLVLKVLPHWNKTLAQHEAEMAAYVRDVLGRDLRAKPRVLVVTRDMGADEMPRLYRAANAFVLASRGEGYGVPYLEAMASGLPTIGTRWSGNVDFMTDDNSYLVDYTVVDVPEAAVREIPDYRGHRWAEPDAASLRRAMRAVFDDRAEAARKAAEGRRYVLEHHAWEPVARLIAARLEESGTPAVRARVPDSLAVTWEGPHRIAFGIAEVNREIGRALDKVPAVDVQPSEAAQVQPWLWGRPPEVTVRHQWPPNFEPPVTGRWITYQPWEYGSLPASWVEPMNRLMDEVWVPSTYVRDCFVRSGVDTAKVAVVPYGIDPSRFHPDVPPMPLPTRKKHRFLFVGGTIARKGADILLDTYLATFKKQDDVCLVIKDLGSTTFYRGQDLGARIKALKSDPTNPEIVYLDSELTAAEMPGLYTACQCLVHPYRGEGFGLPIAEAMACGLAVIVPRHGACLDFCDESVAYLVDAREVRLPEARVGNIPTVEQPWWAEVDRAHLAAAMRRAVDTPDEARKLGLLASSRIRSEWSWDRAAEVAATRLNAVAERAPLLTACVAVTKAERSLARCLESLKGLAHEVVVVDAAQGDRTADIAREHGAKVVHIAAGSSTPASARNQALMHATGEWVLVIDPGECLDDAGRREVSSLIRGEGRAAFEVRTVGPARGGSNGEERLRVRLFPNHPSFRFAGGQGEALVDGTGASVSGRPCGVVLHGGASKSSRVARFKPPT